MATVRKAVELAVRIPHQPGELARLFAAIPARNINVLAYCAYSERTEGVVRLITDDTAATHAALRAAGYACQSADVVVVEATDDVGAVAALGAVLGHAGINILYSYASSAGARQFHAVFKTSDNEQAVRTLRWTATDNGIAC